MCLTCAVIGDPENISPLLGNEIGSIHLKQQLEAIFNMLYQCDYKKFMIGGSNRFDMLASQGILDLRKKHSGIQLCCLKIISVKITFWIIKTNRNIWPF